MFDHDMRARRRYISCKSLSLFVLGKSERARGQTCHEPNEISIKISILAHPEVMWRHHISSERERDFLTSFHFALSDEMRHYSCVHGYYESNPLCKNMHTRHCEQKTEEEKNELLQNNIVFSLSLSSVMRSMENGTFVLQFTCMSFVRSARLLCSSNKAQHTRELNECTIFQLLQREQRHFAIY
jgi:hypothetical protein